MFLLQISYLFAPDTPKTPNILLGQTVTWKSPPADPPNKPQHRSSQRGSWHQLRSASLIELILSIRVIEVQMSGFPSSENPFPRWIRR